MMFRDQMVSVEFDIGVEAATLNNKDMIMKQFCTRKKENIRKCLVISTSFFDIALIELQIFLTTYINIIQNNNIITRKI